MSLIGLGSITKNAMLLLRILELCLVMVDMCVSDGAWGQYQKQWISYMYWNSALRELNGCL